MGGIGSGQCRYNDSKETTDDYVAIDVRRWNRDGLLVPHRSFDWQWSLRGEVFASIRVHTESDRVILNYRNRSGGDDWNDENYPVFLDWTPCNLGGHRPWFLCPAWDCGRRVATLYGGGIFACRRCYDLAYPTQRETYHDRALRKANNIRKKLGWMPGIVNGDGPKPRAMHWSTFLRLAIQHDVSAGLYREEMHKRVNLVRASLDKLP